MPRRQSHRHCKSVYGRQANLWIRKNEHFNYLLAVEESRRSVETILTDRKTPKSIPESRMFKTVVSDLIAEIGGSDLSTIMKDIVIHMFDPLIKPSSLEVTPSLMDGAEEALEVPAELITLPPEGEAAGFDDAALLAEAREVFEPIVETLVPPKIASFAKKAFNLGVTSTKQMKARPGTSTGGGPIDAKKKKTPAPSRALSPTIQFVNPHRSDDISAHDLKELTILQHFNPALSDNHNETEVNKRINIWNLHSHSCRLCSWISRYAWPLQDAHVPLTGLQVSQVLTLHVWASKNGELSYDHIWTQLSEDGVFAAGYGKVDVEKFFSYSS